MRHFHGQLQDLFQQVVMMGSVAESMIQQAVSGLVSRNDAVLESVFVK
jgi:hypothetical protein